MLRVFCFRPNGSNCNPLKGKIGRGVDAYFLFGVVAHRSNLLCQREVRRKLNVAAVTAIMTL